MKCPPEIAAILLGILQFGLLQARAAGWSGDAGRAAIEADHIHNLPELIADFSDERLSYYWDAERPSYMDRTDPDELQLFQSYWDQLQPHVKPFVSSVATDPV